MIGMNLGRIMAFVGVVVLIGVVGMIAHTINSQAQQIELLTVERDAAAERAKTNAATLLRYEQAEANNNEVAAQVAASRRALDALAQSINQDIASAPDADDAPLSPVMLRTLDGLRDAYDAAHGSAVRDAGDPNRVEGVRRRDPPAADADTTPVSGLDDAGSAGRLGVPVGRGKAGRSSIARQYPRSDGEQRQRKHDEEHA